MPKNPNIPYEENAKYVSLPSSSSSHSLVTPLITIEQYKSFEERFKMLAPQTREAMVKIAQTSSKFTNGKQLVDDNTAKVLMSFGTEGSLRIIDDLRKNGFIPAMGGTLDMMPDTKTIIRDIAAGKPGFTTPTYNVNGKVVVSDHFDAAGNLAKNVAKIYGVPQARDEAILARAGGIRKELIGTVRPPPPTATAAKPAAMRM